MATTTTVVLSTQLGSQPKQSVTLTWASGVISRVFNPPLPASDSGPTNIIRRDCYGLRPGATAPWPGGYPPVLPPGESLGDSTVHFPYLRNPFGIGSQPVPASSLSPGEHTREFGSLGDDEYIRLKTAEFALHNENPSGIVHYDNAMALLMQGRPVINEIG